MKVAKLFTLKLYYPCLSNQVLIRNFTYKSNLFPKSIWVFFHYIKCSRGVFDIFSYFLIETILVLSIYNSFTKTIVFWFTNFFIKSILIFTIYCCTSITISLSFANFFIKPILIFTIYCCSTVIISMTTKSKNIFKL